jgi:hypothetical protein
MNIMSIVATFALVYIVAIEQCGAQPNPRHLEEIAFDLERNKLIVFGGSEMLAQSFTHPSVLFELSNAGWQKVDRPGPVGRRGHALIYHHQSKRTYLFAGVTGTKRDSLLFDTWLWNGQTWKQLETQTPVKNPEGVYESQNNSILIYGDASDKSREMYGTDQIFQLWQFIDGKWKMLSDSGPRPDGPYEIAFDSKRKALVIPTWGNGKLTVWEWVGNKWNQFPCSNDCPPARNRFALAYSSSNAFTYLFGGRDASNKDKFLGDFWSWNGTEWARIQSENLPPPRAGLTLEDSPAGIVLYGGIRLNDGKTIMTNELWRWSDGSWATVSVGHR